MATKRMNIIAALRAENSRLKAENKSLIAESRTDQVTGIGNRRHFDESLNREISRLSRGSSSVALMAIDLDGFKPINDALGHSAGDDALRAFAGSLKKSVRKTDTVCRVGGDEFMIIAPMPGLLGEASKAADAITVKLDAILKEVNEERRKAQKTSGVSGRPLPISASIGKAFYSGSIGKSELAAVAANLIKTADENMYKNKVHRHETMFRGSLLRKVTV